MMKKILFLFFLISLQVIAQPIETSSSPSIAILGMFHFGETSDLAAIDLKDLHSKKRQDEIKTIISQLEKYKPTKILVEYPMTYKDTLQKRYVHYLKGDYNLGDSETYQIGFRLAELLGHRKIYAMDYKLDLPFDDIVTHLTATNEMDKMNEMIVSVKNLMQEESQLLETMTLSSYLKRMNSGWFDGLANSLYLKEVLDMGSPDNEVGAKVSAVWYQRNMVMLKNITHYIEDPNERILVIVGSSHRAVLRDYIEDRTDLQFIEIADYLDE